VTISSYGLSLLLAMIACVIGGALGGLTLARPGAVLALPPASDDDAPPAPWGAPPAAVPWAAVPWAEGRALGAALILSHATAALFLGYQSSVGAAMALALAMAWLGAAFGRGVSALADKSGGGLNVGNLLFEILIAATLALPFFNAGRLVVRGHGMLV
jgi:hypothetical protein